MNFTSTTELIEILTKQTPLGSEVSLLQGVLRITKYIYLRGDFVYEYTNEFIIDFNPKDAISKSDFANHYNQTFWLIENEIC